MRRLNPSYKKSLIIINALTQRFIDGEKLTIDQVVNELYAPKSQGTYFLAKQKVSGMFYVTIKNRIKKKFGLPFGALNDKHEYGVPATEAEARKVITTLYKLAKGIQNSAVNAQTYFVENKLLPGTNTETISLPVSK